MTAIRDSLSQLADSLCSLLNGHVATRLFVPLSMAVSPQLPLFGVPRRPQRQDLMPDLRPDRYGAPAVRASCKSLAVCKSP
jgi:hypothetical protein